MSDGRVIHIASFPVIVNKRYHRVRCAWCGAILVDNDFDQMRTAGQPWQEPKTWPDMQLVMVDDNKTIAVEYEYGMDLPDNCCAKLDPEVTR